MPTYRFDHFEIDGVTYPTNSVPLIITSDTLITAFYTPITRTVTYKSSPIPVPLSIDSAIIQPDETISIPDGTQITVSVPMEVTV